MNTEHPDYYDEFARVAAAPQKAALQGGRVNLS